MKNFSFQLGTRTEFGPGSIDRIGEETALLGKRAFFVYGKGSIKRNGVYERIINSFKANSIEWKEYSGVSPNPELFHAYKGAEEARDFGAEVIVAAGGGSVIDEAKAISLGYYCSSKEDLWKFYTRDKVPVNGIPIIAVQTMPATGSEMNQAAVITNEITREKFSTRSMFIAPKVSLLDPEITVKIPLRQTAFGCADIISHLTEGFFSNNDSFAPVQEGYALGLASAVKKSMDILLNDPENIKARSTVMWAASLGWNGLGISGWEGAGIPCHTLEHPMSGIYDLPHGAGLSIATPAYLKLRKEKLETRLTVFGKAVLGLGNEPDGEEVIGELVKWYRKTGTPASFTDWDRSVNFDIKLLTKEAEKLNSIWKMSDFTDREIEKCYTLMK